MDRYFATRNRVILTLWYLRVASSVLTIDIKILML